MRYCLECRRISADGPLCTSCGRSFGGRLCNARRRHLNPPDAHVCGQCGSTTLTDPAAYIPLAWLSRLLVGGSLLLFALLAGPYLLALFTGGVGVGSYRNPLVWFFETVGRVLVPIVSVVVVLYGLSAFLPGEAGKSVRRAIDGVVRWLVSGSLRAVQQLLTAIAKLLMEWFGITPKP